mgnify:CR=1 FL=1
MTRRILLVEDDPINVKFMRIVQRLGATMVPTSGALVSWKL